MTKRELKTLTDLKETRTYLNDLYINEMLMFMFPKEDKKTFTNEDMLNAICNAYALGKMRGSKKRCY